MSKKEYITLLLLFFISFFYLIVSCKYGFNVADEGVPLSGALRIMKGDVPLKDFHGYMPGVYYFYYAILKIFGMDILTVRYVISFFTAIMVVMYYLASRKIMSIPFSLSGSFTILAVPGQYFMRYITFFIIVNIITFYRYLSAKPDKKMSTVFYMGIIGGVTLLFRQDFGLMVFFLAVAIFIIKKYLDTDGKYVETFREVKRYISGFFLIILSPVIYYLYEGKLFSILKVNYDVLSGDYRQNMFLPLPNLTSKWHEIGLFYLPLFIYLAAAIHIVAHMRKNNRDKKEIYKLYILLAGIFSFGYAMARTDPWHIVPVILPAVLLYHYYFYHFYSQKFNSMTKKIGLIMFLVIPFLYIYAINNTYGGLIGSIDFSKDKYRLMDIQRAKIYTNPQDASEYSEIVSYIKNNTTSNDKIFIVPFIGLPLYFLSDRINPAYFEWVLPLEPKIYPDVEERIIKTLLKDKTKLIVYVDFPLDGVEERRFKNYAPKLNKWIMENYYLVEIIGDYQILKLGDRYSHKNIFFDSLDYALRETLHSEYIKKIGMDVYGDRRLTLFEHPPAVIKYKMKIPSNSLLNFGIAVAPQVWDSGMGDGVNFEIVITEGERDGIIFSRYINPKDNKNERRWIDESIDISDYGGKDVLLSLKTTGGPNGDNSYDWAGWSKLEFVTKN